MLAALPSSPAGAVVVREVVAPRPGPGQVLVRVRVAEVAPTAPGAGGLAGVVCQLGAASFGLEVGDRVLGDAPAGTWAEYVAVDCARLTYLPPGLPWAHACALAGAARTVEPALDALALRPAERLLVAGAGRGDGPLAVQLALTRRVEVLAVAAPHDHAHLRALGARPTNGLPDTPDAVLLIGAAPPPLEIPRTATTATPAGPPAHPLSLVELWEEYELRPDVAAVLPLARAARALQLAATGRPRGIVVLEPIVSFGR
ncbi:hypothetical protein ACGFX4_26335 [Kitasatospora sp. NPDC048365]|uniref:hypothetical protein n=1 Tax=Kitasatospora sp. NPDC048365 TaxID=3364050 RepID=UPI00371EC1D3